MGGPAYQANKDAVLVIVFGRAVLGLPSDVLVHLVLVDLRRRDGGLGLGRGHGGEDEGL